MLIKEVTYKDFNGMEHKDILHFHLSKSRVLLTDEEKYNKVKATLGNLISFERWFNYWI